MKEEEGSSPPYMPPSSPAPSSPRSPRKKVVKSPSGKGGLNKCGVCDKTFARASERNRHQRIHDEDDRPHACRFCDKTFLQATACQVHERTHTGSRPHVCNVEGCGKAFSDSTTLRRHKAAHSGARPYVCQVPGCGKSYTRSWGLQRHTKSHARDVEGQDDAEGEDDLFSPDSAAVMSPNFSPLSSPYSLVSPPILSHPEVAQVEIGGYLVPLPPFPSYLPAVPPPPIPPPSFGLGIDALGLGWPDTNSLFPGYRRISPIYPSSDQQQRRVSPNSFFGLDNPMFATNRRVSPNSLYTAIRSPID